MKIFHKDLEEYDHSKEAVRLRNEIKSIRFPTYGDFIQIPGSENRIMKEYLSLENGPISNKNYVQFHKLIKMINKKFDKTYRLPHFSELKNTYFKSGNELFRKSFEQGGEWLNEIIVEGRHIVKDPALPKLVAGKFEFEGEKKPIKLAERSGWPEKLNEFDYPEDIGGNSSDEPVWWTIYTDGVYPVVRKNTDRNENCINMCIMWKAKDVVPDTSIRLVEVNE